MNVHRKGTDDAATTLHSTTTRHEVPKGQTVAKFVAVCSCGYENGYFYSAVRAEEDAAEHVRQALAG